MRIFLTGASGMVGRNLLGHPQASRHEWLCPTHSELDLKSSEALHDYMRAKTPDLVIHAAGRVGGIQANLREPIAFLLDNLDMGRNVLMAAADCGVARLLNLGSSCMYPRDRQTPLREEDVLGGPLEPTNEGYAIAKIAVAKLADYINREHDFHYKTLIPCNLYGPHDKFDPSHSHMIPAVIRKLHDAVERNAETVEIWGTGDARREFMFAEDLADAIFFALERFDALPSTLNIGLGVDYSVNEYYRTAAEVVGYQGKFTHDLSKPVGMLRKLTDTTRARQLGWSAQTSLKDGLRKTYEFYRRSIQGETA